MNIGGLRHRVTFQRATVTSSATGEPDNTWADLATVWARVEATGGNEKYAAMQVQADVDSRIICRYQSALSALAPDDRVTWGSITYDIKSVINTEGRNIELQVFVRTHI